MKQVRQYQGMGQPFALSQEGIQLLVQSKVARHLQGAGQDPKLAPDSAAEAFKGVSKSYTKGMAEVGNVIGALMNVINWAQGEVGAVQSQLSGLKGRIGQLEQNGQQLSQRGSRLEKKSQKQQQRKPSLIGF